MSAFERKNKKKKLWFLQIFCVPVLLNHNLFLSRAIGLYRLWFKEVIEDVPPQRHAASSFAVRATERKRLVKNGRNRGCQCFCLW